MRKGRLGQPAAELALGYSESVSFDWRLYRHDIAARHGNERVFATLRR